MLDLFRQQSVESVNKSTGGHVHGPACAVVHYDGAPGCSYSERWRHECEARSILARGDRFERRKALRLVANIRGQKVADDLEKLATEIWKMEHV